MKVEFLFICVILKSSLNLIARLLKIKILSCAVLCKKNKLEATGSSFVFC